MNEAGNAISSSEIENENDTNTAVQEVQENSLRLLYRLLFIFYAESRSLLDTNNRYYYELSLQRLKTEVADRLDRGLPLLSVSCSYWEGLNNLFNLINDGSESRRIPRRSSTYRLTMAGSSIRERMLPGRKAHWRLIFGAGHRPTGPVGQGPARAPAIRSRERDLWTTPHWRFATSVRFTRGFWSTVGQPPSCEFLKGFCTQIESMLKHLDRPHQ